MRWNDVVGEASRSLAQVLRGRRDLDLRRKKRDGDAQRTATRESADFTGKVGRVSVPVRTACLVAGIEGGRQLGAMTECVRALDAADVQDPGECEGEGQRQGQPARRKPASRLSRPPAPRS